MVGKSGRILNRPANSSSSSGKPDRFRSRFRRVSKAILEISAEGQIRSRSQRRNVRKHHTTANRVVPLPHRESVAPAGRRQCLEAKVGQHPCRADVQRIGNNECALALVKCTKCLSFFYLCPHCLFRPKEKLSPASSKQLGPVCNEPKLRGIGIMSTHRQPSGPPGWWRALRAISLLFGRLLIASQACFYSERFAVSAKGVDAR